jgi:hypothetical protein
MIGLFTQDWELFLKIIGIAAVVPLLMAGLLSGAFVSGDRNRANYHSESKEDRNQKVNWMKIFLLISSPNVTLLVILIIVTLLK